ncbi:MAG: PKD domain-containing protein, partial [Bacteroidetes bacterium]
VNKRDNSFSWEDRVGLSATGYSKSSWGDFDNDGDLDFLIATRGRMLVYQNMGNYQFLQQLNVYLPFQDACSAAWGDYDNDGYLDIILTNPGLDTKIYRNTRGITIPGAASQWFNRQDDEALKSYGYGFVNWVDYDNDGDLDFILAKDGLPTKLFKNNLIMKSGLFKPNTAPVAPTGLSATNSVLGVILKWNPVKNDETPFRSMAYNVQIGTRIDSANICSSNSSSTGFRKIPALGNGQLDTTFLLKNLPARKYYWSVQAVDQGLKGGVFSVVDSFDVKNILAFFSADTVCFGLNTTFTNQSAAFGGDVIQNYLWNFGDGTTSTLQNPTHLFSSSGVHNVSLIASSATNSDTLVKQVLVKIKPPVDFTANVACQGTETSIVNQTNTTGLNILSWTWDYGDGKGSTFQNPVSHGYLTAGDYQLTLIAAADNGCSGTIMKTVSVGAYPVATITASTPLTFCSGDSVALSVESNVKYSYNWILDGTSLTGGNTNRFLARSSGNYSVEVVNSTGACKTTSIPVSVTAQNAPTAPLISAGGTLQFCQGDSVTLSVTNTAGYTYQWKLNGGAVGANTNQFIAKNSGSYNVVVSNSTGCIASSTNTINVTVNSLPVAGAVSLSGSTTFCEGGSVILSISPSTGNSYNWRNANGLIAGANTNLYTAIRSGIYQLEITNASGCVVKTSSVSVLVKPMPKNPVIVPSDNYKAGKCLGEIPVKLNIDQVISGYNFQWYYNGVAINSANSSFIEGFLSPGNYYMEAGLNGCSAWSDTLNLHFEDAPAKPDIYATGPTVWYLACSNDSATQYKWYYNGNLIQGADKYLYVANQKLGKYNVSISNIKGCFTVSDTLKIPLGGTGIEDIYPFAGMKIYPNPTPGLFTIEMDNLIFGELMINILNQGGMQILKIKFEKTTEHFSSQIDLSGQAKGMYIINLKKDKYLATRKLVVN